MLINISIPVPHSLQGIVQGPSRDRAGVVGQGSIDLGVRGAHSAGDYQWTN